ncbi:hypothetical protein [Butyrivibrio sp. NC2002]|uniref:hypothetical protein n=1 Tax=Butyrivibrio sp. NC2002 TaxID=1410610 RepID=UPI00055C1A8B|nr:hypothetical protein [Butyrivibrio sp. NC2002]
MSKFSKLGASALALALALTMVPVDANAMVDYNYSADGKTYTATSKETGKSAGYEKVTWGDYDDYYYDRKSGDSDYATNYYVPKKVNVQLKCYTDVTIPFSYGQVSISKLKVNSGKANITVKQSGYDKNINDTYETYTENADGTSKRYYTDPATGAKTEITDSNKENLYNWGSATIRVYGKKAGKSVISFQINDANGNKVATKKITVTVKENASAFKNVTFAGKKLIEADGKHTYDNINDGYDFTTKKSGKFKVTMNKGFKLKSIYVEKYLGEEKYASSDSYTSTRSITTRLDLNGDGDCKDTIDGISESEKSSYSYEKIKNGKKVKLNTVPSYDYEKLEYKDSKADGTEYTVTNENEYKGNLSSTRFYVVYQDTLTKEWDTSSFTITRRVSKK